MASLYCQELIRNSKTLCESYIGEIVERADKKQKLDVQKEDGAGRESDIEPKSHGQMLNRELRENYYLEDDKKLLDILIKNCHPILTDILTQIDNFNSYNKAFDLKQK